MWKHSVLLLLLVAVLVVCTYADDATDALVSSAKEAQEKVEKVTEAMYTRLAEVEKEYRLKRRPLFKDRGAAIAKIPNFWKQAILNHPSHRNWVTDADIDALSYLEAIDVTELDDEYDGHYKIALTFKENPLFKDRVVSRSVPAASHDGQEYSGVQWNGQHGPNILMAFFDGSLTDHGQVSEVAHAIRFDLFVNPFPYYEYVEPQHVPDLSGDAPMGTEEFEQPMDYQDDSQFVPEDAQYPPEESGGEEN
eukprot:PhM_4_TR8589/c0_g1_i1/m.67800/K11290/SET, TAF1, I2PP2A; template-activating factor I